jgi:hypothetical protein
LISLLLVVCVAVCVAMAVAALPLLAVGSLRRSASAVATLEAFVPALARPRARISEAIRLRLAAALLDLGNHLMLSAEERRAIRLRRWLFSMRAHRLGVGGGGGRAGAKRLDDVTLEIPIDERTQEGNPGRTLALSCVVYESPGHHASDPLDDGASLFWRVVNRASPGRRGPSVTVDVPDLDRALIAYHARSLRLAGEATGARFFDEGTHDEPAV